MIPTSRRRAGVVLFIVLALLTAGCGSRRAHVDHVAAVSSGGLGPGATSSAGGSDGTATTSAGRAPGATGAGAADPGAAGPTGAPPDAAAAPGNATTPGVAGEGPRASGTLRIGMVGAMSGLVGSTLQPNYDGLRIWVQYANEQLGGANGATIELLTADDQSDPARHRSLVQQLVDESGVQAFANNGEPFSGAGSVAFHQDRGIPVIGSEGVNQYVYENSMYFPQMSHGLYVALVAIGAAGQWAQANGASNFGLLVCSESTACTETIRIAREHGDELGVNTVYSAEASLAKTDFTSECVNARNADVQLFLLSGDANFVSRVAASCARQQYFPTIAVTSSIAAPQHFTDPNIRGYIAASPVAPYFLDEIPAVAEFQAAAARYAPDAPLSIGLMTGWVSGKLLERATRGITQPTTEQLLAGLHTIEGDTLGGLTGPLRFPPGGTATPFACWWVIEKGDDGTPMAPFGAQSTCSDIRP